MEYTGKEGQEIGIDTNMPTLNKRCTDTPRRQGSNYREIYQSHRWHSHSRAFLKANPLCKRCKDKGIIERAEVTDHTIPLIVWIPQGGDPFDVSNHQPLSKRCHSIKTKEDKKKYRT
jgi:5-methylcytosine-specific restriction endonuclease McrA